MNEDRNWSATQILPNPFSCPLGISSGIVLLSSGRLLAPMAALPARNRLGETVAVLISDDNGRNWDKYSVVFKDLKNKYGESDKTSLDNSNNHINFNYYTF